jgi:hypothetical protein
MAKAGLWVIAWILCALTALVALVAVPVGAALGRRRTGRVLVAFDQLANVLMGGIEDETISARAWRNRHLTRWRVAMHAIDAIAWHVAGDEHHCEEASRAEALRYQALARLHAPD